MKEKMIKQPIQEKRSIFASIFPREYDFEGMLAEQSDRTILGINEFIRWLDTIPLSNPVNLERIENEVDLHRRDLEEKLVKSFSTPFDRQDIFSISRQMDYILNFSKETAKEMYAFGVHPDKTILEMTRELLCGTECISRGVRNIKKDKDAVDDVIHRWHDRTAENRRCNECIADTGDLSPPEGCRAGNEGYTGYPPQCGY
jgi:hypothetical protein